MEDKKDGRVGPLGFQFEQSVSESGTAAETADDALGDLAPQDPVFIGEDPASREEPYLSLVVTSRNDDHGGDMNRRMQLFIDDLAWQCGRTGLDAELIVVEWNPPPDRPGLKDALDWPDGPDNLTIRLVEVPPHYHNRLENSDRMGLYQMIAKNVGVRRARGKFILATNIDLVFNDELMDFLARRELNPKCFYLIDRYDVPDGVLADFPNHETLLEYCRSNVIRVHRDEREIHANACGDFTLMSREAWLELKGYPEVELWSIYLDGILVHMAYASGLRQVVLLDPMRIYHAEHKKGWAVEQPTTGEIPRLDYNRDYLPWIKKMLTERRSINPNPSSWGFADENLPDRPVGPGAEDDETLAARRRRDLEKKLQSWINKLALSQKQLYFRDQTFESLMALAGLVEKYRPTRVVELGTLSGLSLRTWLAADPDLRVAAVDLSFKALYQSRDLLELDLSRVELIERNILEVDFPTLWSKHDRVLFFVDAHDLPGVPIMDHVLENAVPYLPAGSVLAVDDLWYSPDQLDEDGGRGFFDKVFEKEIDTLQCFTGHYAPYWKGGSFFGFMEVRPLLEWAARREAEVLTSGNKMVLVEDPRAADKGAGPEDFDIGRFNQKTGLASHNPMSEENLAGYEGGPASELFQQVEKAYADKDLKTAVEVLDRAVQTFPQISGAFYGLAVCHARVGRMEEAVGLLERELGQLAPHPRAGGMKTDIENWLSRAGGQAPGRGEKPGTMKKGLTIFGLPKAFTGSMNVMQRNAIISWTRLEPRPEIILMGDDPGTAELADELGLIHIPDIARNEHGTPLVNSMFSLAEQASSSNILAYVNADIILTRDFIPAVNQAAEKFKNFLMIGRRWDMDLLDPLDFTGDWEASVRDMLKTRGQLHAETGLDYFVFTRGVYPAVPPFAVGRCAWDNWLVYDPIQRKLPVIDASEAVTAVHQNHDYSHAKGGKEEVWQGAEAQYNRSLVVPEAIIIGASSSAPLVMTPNGLAPRSDEEIAKRQVAAHVQAGRALAAAGDYHGSLARFDQAIQLMTRYCFQAQGVHFMAAQILMDIGRPDVAVKALQAELAAFPNMVEAKEMLAKLNQRAQGPSELDLKLKNGEELIRQGRLNEAEEFINQVLQQKPDHLEAMNALAILRWSQDRRPDAVNILRDILNREPFHRAANWNLGQFLKEAGLEDEARKVYRAYIDNNPGETGMAEEMRNWDNDRS